MEYINWNEIDGIDTSNLNTLFFVKYRIYLDKLCFGFYSCVQHILDFLSSNKIVGSQAYHHKIISFIWSLLKNRWTNLRLNSLIDCGVIRKEIEFFFFF